MFLEEPPAFTPAEQQQLGRLQEQLASLTRLHRPDVTAEQAQANLQQAQPLLQEFDRLRRRQQDRQRYERILQIQAGSASERAWDDPVDFRALFRLYEQFQQYEKLWLKAQKDETDNPAYVPDPETPGTNQWLALARAFEAYQACRFRINWAGTGRFHLRTFLLKGKCHLYAAVQYWREGRETLARNEYENGLRVLQRVMALAHLIQTRGTLEQMDTLGSELHSWIEDWDATEDPVYDDLVKVGITALLSDSTTGQLRQVLQAYCPWGVPMYFFLKDIGVLDNVDLGILHSFYKPSTLLQPPKLFVKSLKASMVPWHIVRDMAELVGGPEKVGTLRFPDGTTRALPWAAKNEPTYSLWVVSPAIYDLKPSEMLSYITYVRKLLFSYDKTKPYYGSGDYFMDLGMDAEVSLAERHFGQESTFHAVSKTIVGAENAGVDKDLLFNYTESGFNFTKLVQTIAGAAFSYMEEKEIAWLFEGIDPENTQLGDFKSYADHRIPPIILRAELFGFEDTPPHEFRRTHRAIRYYALDYGSVSGLDTLYQLNDLMSAQIAPVANAKEYRAGNEAVVARMWPLLPNKPLPLGMRCHTIDFTPKAQTLWIELDQQLYEAWSKQYVPVNTPRDLPEVRFYDANEMSKPKDQRRDFTRVKLHDRNVIVQFLHAPYFDTTATTYMDPWWSLRQASPLFEQLPRQLLPVLQAGALETHTRGGGACLYRPLERQYLAEVWFGSELKAEIPIMYLGRRDKGQTGTITWPIEEVSVCLMKLPYPEVANKPVEVTPLYTELMRSRLQISATSTYSGGMKDEGGRQVMRLSARDKTITIRGILMGMPLKQGYHKVEVELAGRTYVMWANVRHAAAGAASIECDLPVPFGQHEVTVTTADAEPFAFTIVREGAPGRSSPELEQTTQQFNQARAAYTANRSHGNAVTLCNYYAKLAWQMWNLDRYQEAHDLCVIVKNNDPELDRRKSDFTYLLTFYESSFHVGDLENLFWAGARYADTQGGTEARKAFQQYGRGHDSVASQARQAAYRYAELIRRWVSLGGDVRTTMQLYRSLMDFWSMAGYDDSVSGQWDFRLPFEFGPTSP
jgi:hypothetical protein